MAVRSVQPFTAVNMPGNGTTNLLYTVPSGRTLILRTVSLYASGSGNSGLVTLFLVPPAGNYSFLFSAASITLYETKTLSGWYVLNPGVSLHGQAFTNQVTVAAWGSLLLGAPE